MKPKGGKSILAGGSSTKRWKVLTFSISLKYPYVCSSWCLPRKPRLKLIVCIFQVVKDIIMLCIFKSFLAILTAILISVFNYLASVWNLGFLFGCYIFFCVMWHLFWKAHQPNIQLQHTREHKLTHRHICDHVIYIHTLISFLIAPPPYTTTKTKLLRALYKQYDPEEKHTGCLDNGVSGVILVFFWGLKISRL